MGAAVKVTAVPGQTGLLDAVTLTDGLKLPGATEKVMPAEVTLLTVAQGALDNSEQVTVFPLVMVLVVKVVPVAPATGLPLIFHWYCGLKPGNDGTAVKVTVFPLQMVLPVLAEMLTDAGPELATVSAAGLEVSVLPQPVILQR